jgi:hypothetical protein
MGELGQKKPCGKGFIDQRFNPVWAAHGIKIPGFDLDTFLKAVF